MKALGWILSVIIIVVLTGAFVLGTVKLADQRKPTQSAVTVTKTDKEVMLPELEPEQPPIEYVAPKGDMNIIRPETPEVPELKGWLVLEDPLGCLAKNVLSDMIYENGELLVILNYHDMRDRESPPTITFRDSNDRIVALITTDFKVSYDKDKYKVRIKMSRQRNNLLANLSTLKVNNQIFTLDGTAKMLEDYKKCVANLR